MKFLNLSTDGKIKVATIHKLKTTKIANFYFGKINFSKDSLLILEV